MGHRGKNLNLLILLGFSLVLACRSTPPGVPSSQPLPASVAEAEQMKQKGAAWTNGDIRAFYLKTIATIAPQNQQWIKDQLPAEERARRAYQVRHDARLTARAMMHSDLDVKALRERDQLKYGNPDGPTLDWLVESGKKKGRTGDALYEAIVDSAQRTDGAINELYVK